MNVNLPASETVRASFDPKSKNLTFTLSGDLKSTTVTALHRDIFAVLESEQNRGRDIATVQLDLRDAVMLDSLGINLIISVLKWTRQRTAELSIDVAKNGVYGTLLAVGLNRQAEVKFHE